MLKSSNLSFAQTQVLEECRQRLPAEVLSIRDEDDICIRLEAAAGVLKHPLLAQKLVEGLLVPVVAESLRDESEVIRVSDMIVDDRKSGTKPKPTATATADEWHREPRVVDDRAQMIEAYRDAAGVAVWTLAQGWWRSHEGSCDGGASRRYGTAFNIGRLLCSDIDGSDDAARDAIQSRLRSFSEASEDLAGRHLPRLDVTR
jgi:hypothetical protein